MIQNAKKCGINRLPLVMFTLYNGEKCDFFCFCWYFYSDNTLIFPNICAYKRCKYVGLYLTFLFSPRCKLMCCVCLMLEANMLSFMADILTCYNMKTTGVNK